MQKLISFLPIVITSSIVVLVGLVVFALIKLIKSINKK